MTRIWTIVAFHLLYAAPSIEVILKWQNAHSGIQTQVFKLRRSTPEPCYVDIDSEWNSEMIQRTLDLISSLFFQLSRRSRRRRWSRMFNAGNVFLKWSFPASNEFELNVAVVQRRRRVVSSRLRARLRWQLLVVRSFDALRQLELVLRLRRFTEIWGPSQPLTGPGQLRLETIVKGKKINGTVKGS